MEQEVLFSEGEEIIHEAHKHPIVYLADFVLHTFGCGMFSGLAIASTIFFGSLGASIAYVLIFFVILFWISFFYAWTKNYFDVWYVTNKRIIAVNQRDMLHREVDYMAYDRIQDVFFDKDGMLQTFFGYGTLRVENAGKEQETIMLSVKDVETVAHMIMDLRDKTHGGNGAV